MNDRYLYRAKRTDNGEWVEGYLYGIWEKRYILWGMTNDKPDMIEVDPSTICQCTGRKDEEQNLIFEHDIVCYLDGSYTDNGFSESYQCGEVLWDDETLSFQVTERLSAESYEAIGGIDCKVIGNIFDNTELLEVGECQNKKQSKK